MAKAKKAAKPPVQPQPEQANIGVQIDRVDIIDFTLASILESTLEPKEFSFSVQLEMKLDPALKLALVMVFITALHAKDGQPTEPHTILGKLTTGVAFRIENYNEAVSHAGERIVMLPGLVTMLNSIALSTARGTFSAMFRGTYLHNAVLPIIDPKQFKPA